MSLVQLVNEAQASEPDGNVFSGIQRCDPEAHTYLLRHPDLRPVARAACETIRAEYHDAEVSVRLDVDQDDGERSVVFHVRVPGLTASQRLGFYRLTADLAEGHESRFTFVVDRV